MTTCAVFGFMQKLPEKADGYKPVLQEKNVNWLYWSLFLGLALGFNVSISVCFWGISMRKSCGLL
jgi:hypothetical protein